MKLHRNAKLSVKGRVQRAAAPGTPGRGVPERLRCAIRSRAPAAACMSRSTRAYRLSQRGRNITSFSWWAMRRARAAPAWRSCQSGSWVGRS
jgi:hypothetical protein